MNKKLRPIVLFLLVVAALFYARPRSGFTQGPVPQAAPTRPAPLKPPPPRTGYVPLPLDLSHLKGDRMPVGIRAEDLPRQWDWRHQGVVTPVQDQNPCGACYAFASLGNFESKLQLDGAGTYDFSENNAKECPWHDPGCGGSNNWEMAGWFSQKGTVLESCDPYVNQDVSCKTTCPYIKTLLDLRIISDEVPDASVLKGYIYNYGPVYAAMYAGDYSDTDWWQEFSDYDGSYTLYYEGSYEPNHAVLIVGWDDDLHHAGGTGGWIVKNSWGTDWGGTCGYGTERGYFTIAYGSARIGVESSFVYAWQDYDENGGVMLYDEVGLTDAWGYIGRKTGWGLCTFTPPSSTTITRVEFYTTDRTTDVDVYIYDDFDGTTLGNLQRSVLDLAFHEAGYHSVAVVPPLPVTHGDDVIAVVKFTNASHPYPIPADGVGPYETQRTYISPDGSSGSWEDLGAGEHEDVAIRLRTSEMPPAIGIYLPIILKARPPVTPTPTPTPSWTTIATQGFEGSFPSSGWQVDDQSDEDGGEYTWGRRDCRAHNGSHSAWSVGGGDDGRQLGCGQGYRNNMDAWMTYGPFDLRGASAAELAFHFWNESEEDYDELFWGASVDDVSYYGEFRSGDWTEWEPVTFDLADWLGESQVWIGFSFWSDDTVAVGEGAFVDDVMLRKMPGGQEDGRWKREGGRGSQIQRATFKIQN